MSEPTTLERLAASLYEHYTVPVVNETIRIANEASPEMLAMVLALRWYVGREPLVPPETTP